MWALCPPVCVGPISLGVWDLRHHNSDMSRTVVPSALRLILASAMALTPAVQAAETPFIQPVAMRSPQIRVAEAVRPRSRFSPRAAMILQEMTSALRGKDTKEEKKLPMIARLELARERLSVLRERIPKEVEPPKELTFLLERVDRLRDILDRLIKLSSGKGGALVPGMSAKLLVLAGDKSDENSLKNFQKIVGGLVEAGRLPPSALGRFFDNLRASQGDSGIGTDAGPTLDSGTRGAQTSGNYPKPHYSMRTRAVPAPFAHQGDAAAAVSERKGVWIKSTGKTPWKAQYGELDEQGRFQIKRVVQKDGSTVDILGKNFVKVSGANGKLKGYQVDLSARLGAAKGKDRDKASGVLAREIVSALGMENEDGKRSRALQGWLSASFNNDQVASVQLRIDGKGKFALIYSYKNGRNRIESAQWGSSSAYRGKRQSALIVQRPVHLDKEGKGRVDPRRWREFLGTGGYNQWSSSFSTEKSGFFTSAKSVENVKLVRYRQMWGKLQKRGWEHKDRIVNEIPGTSTMGIIGTGLHQSWGVGHILRGAGWVGKSLYTGVVAGGQELIYAATGSESYGLDAIGGYANNPAVRLMLDDSEYVARLSDVQEILVKDKARKNREASLRAIGITRQNSDFRQYEALLGMSYSDEELVGAMGNYGAGNYGRLLLEKAAEEEGWSKAGLTAAGTAMRFGESVGEMMMNPLIWATLGLGAASNSLNLAKVAGTGTTHLSAAAVPYALNATVGTQSFLTSLLYSSWMVSGVDNAGQFFLSVGEGDHTKTWTKAADFGTDLFFLGAMIQQGHSRAAARARGNTQAGRSAPVKSVLGEMLGTWLYLFPGPETSLPPYLRFGHFKPRVPARVIENPIGASAPPVTVVSPGGS